MRFDRESYRKLYVAESAEHQLIALASRGLRDYLLRFAAEDGTLLPSTSDPIGDMMVVLRARPSDRKLVSAALADLQRVGYLKLERKRLWIVRFEEAQEARTPGAKRQKKHRDKNKPGGGDPEGGTGDVTDNVTDSVTPSVTESVTSNATRNAHVTSPLIEIADETRREPPKPPTAADGWPSRPVIRPDLLNAPVAPRDWQIPAPFERYALEIGVSALQFVDVVTEFREKNPKPATPNLLASLLFRYIETRGKRNLEKAAGRATAPVVALYENPIGVDPPDIALRKASFPEDFS